LPSDRLKSLGRENRELRQANEMLREALAYFARAELGSVLAVPPERLRACAPFRR
jgi:transposase-like protein